MQLEQLLCSCRASTKNINFSEWAILLFELKDNPPLLPQFHRFILNGFIIISFPPVDDHFSPGDLGILDEPYFPFYNDWDN
jgi:hypothetical protein